MQKFASDVVVVHILYERLSAVEEEKVLSLGYTYTSTMSTRNSNNIYIYRPKSAGKTGKGDLGNKKLAIIRNKIFAREE